MGFRQDFHRKIIGRLTECLDVREGIEGAFRIQTIEAGDLVQAIDDDVAATVILFQKITDIILRSGDCSDCGFLDEGRDAESDAFPELSHAIDGFMIADDISDPPTRHRIGFGQAVHYEMIIFCTGYLEQAEMFLSIINETFVDFI